MKKTTHTISLFCGLAILLIFSFYGCATFKPQLDETIAVTPRNNSQKLLEKSIFIAGGFGNMKNGKTNNASLNLLNQHLAKADKNALLFFTGDNIPKGSQGPKNDFSVLDQQLKLTESFKGTTYFLPGDNEWKSGDIARIDVLEDYIKSKKNVKTEEDCPLKQIRVDSKLDIILVNSKWFTSDWDEIKGINKTCTDIVTPRRFLEQLQNYINDAQGKNVIIAMHHPVFSNGHYSGEHTFASQMLPLPVLGSIITGVEGLAGLSEKFTSHPRYNAFRVLMSYVAQESDRITFISGHENSLQYLTGQNGTHQIISGALGKTEATHRSKGSISTSGGTLMYEGKYTNAANGFARLDYYTDGSSTVTFITSEGASNTFDVQSPLKAETDQNEPISTETRKEVVTSILTDYERNKMDKSAFYKMLWGKRYREYFTKSATAPVAILDTLYGGLKVAKKGGGHQSWTLRLEDKNEKQYAMRSLDKNALRILESNIFGTAYNIDEFEGTATEKVIYDFFSTSHPYMLLPISPLAKAAKVNHANASLYYVPKQNALGQFNTVYGDGLYFIEERPSDGWFDSEAYTRTLPEPKGKITKFRSTTDMMEKLQKSDSYSVDERSFVRARLFDMLIGDWDRHADQYRWGEYKINDNDKRFVAIPRDRDNAFPKFQGPVISFLKWFTPLIRSWQTYGPEIKNLKWLNDKGNMLDNVLLSNVNADLWITEAQTMQANISAQDIDKAFAILPKEMADATAEDIKFSLKQRLKDLDSYARTYGEYLSKRAVLFGTHEKDIVEIERLPDGKTKINIKQADNSRSDSKEKSYEYDRDNTKEIWLYGLNENDKFKVTGKGDHEILIRIVGGFGKDSFSVENRKALKVYDHTYEEIIFDKKTPRKQLTDSYRTNLFHWRNIQENHNTFIPSVGFRADDGFYIGGVDTYTVNGINGDPFRQQHTLAASYYFDFEAVRMAYTGVFANLFPKTNLEVNLDYTSDGFSNNFFGFGNETLNNDDILGRDFYRSRIRQFRSDVGIATRLFKWSVNYENYEVMQLNDRFFVPENVDPQAFESQNYLGTEIAFRYENSDAAGFPTRGFGIELTAGYKANTDVSEINFGYALGSLSLTRKLVTSGSLVFSTKLEGKTNFGDDFLYYHAPSIGGDNGLRGFRDERFTGKSYLYQSSDIRLRIMRYPTAVVPVTFGIFGGFDYGRVWLQNDSPNVWHTSQGGGLWFGGLNDFGLNVGYFNSSEGNLVQIGFGFSF